MKDKPRITLSLRDKWEKIPVNKLGDPHFTDLKLTNEIAMLINTGKPHILTVQEVFTDDEIVIIVNRYLFAAKYQKENHDKNYALRRAEELKRRAEHIHTNAERQLATQPAKETNDDPEV